MQNQVSAPFYIKVQYKHIIKKLKVTEIQKLSLDSIFIQFSQYFNGRKPFLHLQNLDQTSTTIFSDQQLHNVLMTNTNNKIIRFHINKTSQNIQQNDEFKKKKYESKSQCISLERLTSSWILYESMIECDNSKLRKISDDLVESRRQLRQIKGEKRQTNLSQLLSFT